MENRPRMYCRFLVDQIAKWGEVTGNTVVELAGDPFTAGGLEPCKTVRRFALDQMALTVPCTPSKIVCVGVNYLKHAAELQSEIRPEPTLFLKAPSALLPHQASIRYPKQSNQVHYEGELAVIMGKRCHHTTPAQALGYVWGYTCANEVTARDLQRQDGQWARGKSFDTFLPLGPVVVDQLPHAEKTQITTYVNGQCRQTAPIEQMRFSLAELIAYISQNMTLLPGDLILTGTPEGVGPLQIGDRVEVDISGIGRLINQVEKDEA